MSITVAGAEPEFVMMCDAKPGLRLRADGGFTCIEQGALLTVETDSDGIKFVPCSHGRHYLDGQLAEDGRLVGLFSAESEEHG